MFTIKYGFSSERSQEVGSEWICSQCVGPGWRGIIDRLHADLYALGWNGVAVQIKEKFGGLRYYIDKGTPEIYDRIAQAEAESLKTCEVTGKPGEVRYDLSWVRCLCDEEFEKALAAQQERF